MLIYPRPHRIKHPDLLQELTELDDEARPASANHTILPGLPEHPSLCLRSPAIYRGIEHWLLYPADAGDGTSGGGGPPTALRIPVSLWCDSPHGRFSHSGDVRERLLIAYYRYSGGDATPSGDE